MDQYLSKIDRWTSVEFISGTWCSTTLKVKQQQAKLERAKWVAKNVSKGKVGYVELVHIPTRNKTFQLPPLLATKGLKIGVHRHDTQAKKCHISHMINYASPCK